MDIRINRGNVFLREIDLGNVVEGMFGNPRGIPDKVSACRSRLDGYHNPCVIIPIPVGRWRLMLV